MFNLRLIFHYNFVFIQDIKQVWFRKKGFPENQKTPEITIDFGF